MTAYTLIFLVIIGLAMVVILLLCWMTSSACWGHMPDLSDGASEDLDSGSAEESGGGFDFGGDFDFFC